MKATRDWFGETLLEVSEANEKVVVVNCDLASATKTSMFKARYPSRFLECGIAEANAIGVAAGLAQEGYRPFVASFGHFLTGKYLEIFQSVGLNGAGVVLVGTHAGLAIGQDGPTQMGLRDLALIRTLHNIEILHPADGLETRQMLDYATANSRPTYLRLCRQPLPEVHASDDRFSFGQPRIVHHGEHLVVFTMGGMVAVLLAALPLLAGEGLRPTIVNVSSLPSDPQTINEIATAHDHVAVVEDHHVTGGLVDHLARTLIGRPVRFHSWGVADYGQAASADELYAHYRLDPPGIASVLRDFTSSNARLETLHGR